MTGPMLDMHDSADITAEPNSHSRLVMASNARDVSNETNTGASLSLPKTEQNQADLHENSSLPTSSDDDGDDGRVASEDEVRELLHVVDKIPVRLWIACIAGILERFVWYGATAPLQNYLQNSPGGEVPGALGLHQATASNIVNALIIGSYITPVPAAVVADSWLGRYKTMLYCAMYCDI
ncbi:unnamed protein product [Penicillium pancosmium]